MSEYEKFIQNIIDTRGQWNIPDGEYYEAHHIIPRCMGGLPKNSKNTTKHENIIWLYPREHFIAHKLLAEENTHNYKLISAFWNMCTINGSRVNITPEEYEEARLLYINREIPEETREKLSKSHIGKKQTKETKEKISKSNIGQHRSEETKMHIRESALRRNSPRLGKKHSEETKEKISKSKRGCVSSRKGCHLSEETKEKISKSKQGHIAWDKGIKRTDISGSNHYLAKKIICIETGEIFDCINDARKKYNCSGISACVRGVHKTAAGYHWKYLESEEVK